MKFLIVLACVVCAFSKPANEKRFFGLFGDSKTTQHPALDRLKNIEGEVGKFVEKLRHHHMNVTNSTNGSFKQIADVLQKLEESAKEEMDGFVGKFHDLKEDMEEDLEGAKSLVEEAQQLFDDKQSSFEEHAKDQLGKIHEKFNEN